MTNLWDEIEKNTLGLLENEFATSEQNKFHLIGYLKSLYEMKMSIMDSNTSMGKLKTVMEGFIGIESSLNQAVRFLIADISSYIAITDRIETSIDKIFAKSKFVVGDINYGDLVDNTQS